MHARPGDAPAPSYGTLLLICCAVTFGCYFASYMRIPVVPLYAKQLGAGTARVGLINSAFFLMAGLLSFPLGILSDRLGRKRLAASGLLVLSATSFFLVFSTTPAQLLWIYVFFGVGLAAFGPTMMSTVADFSPATHLGRSYGWYTTALYSGMSLGPAAGGGLARALGFLDVFLVSGMVTLAVFLVLLLFLPRSHRTPEIAHGSSTPPGAFQELFQNRPLQACWLSTLGGCFGLGMFITFVPLHAQNQGLHVGQIGLVFFVQGLVNAVARVPLGHLSDRVSDRKNLVLAGIVGLAAAMAGFGASRTLPHFLLFALVLGTSMALAFTSVGALIAETVPARSRGLAMGGYNTCIYFGIMLSSATMGAVIEAIGFQEAFLVTAAANLVLTAVFGFLMKGFKRGAATASAGVQNGE